MDLIKKGWFSELSQLFPGQAMSLEVKKMLVEKKTLYQDLKIFESTHHGNVLVLDGVIQATERDEFMYQEMISFLPLNSHPNPQKVLIIGGGDGGVSREVAKFDSVKTVIQCEIDEDVVELSKVHMPFMGIGFQNPKVTLFIGDGFKYLQDHKNEFDVIITDSTDPEGPAEALFGSTYFQLVCDALKEDGIMCSQGENVWLHLDIIKGMLRSCREIFPVVSYAKATVTTYPNGEIGYVLCSKNKNTKFEEPLIENLSFQSKLRFYSSKMHRASFVMPYSIEKELEDIEENRRSI